MRLAILEDFLSYTYGLAAGAGFKNCIVVPDDIWEHAAETFGWDGTARGRQVRKWTMDERP